MRIAAEVSAPMDESAESLAQRIDDMITRRTVEVLANPNSPAAAVLAVARIEMRKRVLDLHRQKYDYHRTSQDDIAIEALGRKARRSREAQFAFARLKEALDRAPAHGPLPMLGFDVPDGLKPFIGSSPALEDMEKARNMAAKVNEIIRKA